MTPQVGKTYTRTGDEFSCGGRDATLARVDGNYLFLTCAKCGLTAISNRDDFPNDYEEANMNETEIKQYLASDEKRLERIEAEAIALKAAIQRYNAQLRALVPPFAVGDQARVLVGKAKGSPVTVVAVDKAFGDYVVQATFPRNPERIYTYQASDLEKQPDLTVGTKLGRIGRKYNAGHDNAKVTGLSRAEVYVTYGDGCEDILPREEITKSWEVL